MNICFSVDLLAISYLTQNKALTVKIDSELYAVKNFI